VARPKALTGAPLHRISEVIPSRTPLIDTIRLRGPIIEHRLSKESYVHSRGPDGVYEERFTSGRQNLPHFQLHVRVLHGNYEAVIERSLPTMQFGHNANAVDVMTATRLVGVLYEEAADHVKWAVPVEQLRISRLDVDRDFTGVNDLDFLLRGLATLSVARSGNAKPVARLGQRRRTYAVPYGGALSWAVIRQAHPVK